MINVSKPVVDILGKPVYVKNIVAYRKNAGLNIGIVVGVHKVTYSVINIPNPRSNWSNFGTNPKYYDHLRKALDNPKAYKKVVPQSEGIVISLDQLMNSTTYHTPELEDILSHHLTR